ncbi:unnamed protein product, partial [Brachionus calyciflorus]
KKEIKRNLIKENIQPPTDNQIQHIINSFNNSEIPDDEDAVFVGKFEYAAMPSQIFRVFLTSKRLIKIFEPELFPIALKLFQEKWSRVNSPAIKTFLEYFDNQWCKDGNNGWYEGFAPGLPSTSNSLESTHAQIKKILNLKRFGLIPFLNECRDNILKEWSTERAPTLSLIDPETNQPQIVENLNQKIFYEFPNVKKDDLVKAYKWNSYNKTIIHLKDDNYYYLTATNIFSKKKNTILVIHDSKNKFSLIFFR